MNAKQKILNDFNSTFNQSLESFEDIENFLDSEKADGITETEIDNFDYRNSINYKNL
jgi:hypothetical protein